MNSDFNRGAMYARDLTTSTIIGFQNEIGDTTDPKYEILQKLLMHIINTQGDLHQPFKP